MTKTQNDIMNELKNLLYKLYDECDKSDSFSETIADMEIFHRSIDDVIIDIENIVE